MLLAVGCSHSSGLQLVRAAQLLFLNVLLFPWLALSFLSLGQQSEVGSVLRSFRKFDSQTSGPCLGTLSGFYSLARCGIMFAEKPYSPSTA